MASQLQNFLANAAIQSATDLETALRRLPQEKRGWSPQGDARTALDMVAECAILTGSTARLIKSRQFTTDFQQYALDKAALAKDEAAMLTMLHESAIKAAESIRAVPDDDLAFEVDMPWGPMTLEQIIAYPYWNMSYHEGQINYIASMLGCLE